MFRLEHAVKFDKFFTQAQQPVQRVKPRNSAPHYAWELTKINTANASGIPLHSKGRTTATPRYKVTLYCDVCALPLASLDARGKEKEVEVTELETALKSEKPLLEKQHLEMYAGQCGQCGRWSGKGSNHTYCFDPEQKTCTKCIG